MIYVPRGNLSSIVLRRLRSGIHTEKRKRSFPALGNNFYRVRGRKRKRKGKERERKSALSHAMQLMSVDAACLNRIV